MGEAQHLGDGHRDVHGVDDAAPDGVVDVVVDVGDLVGQADDPPLQGLGGVRSGMAEDAPAHLIAEVEALPILLQHVHHPHRLLIVGKTAGQDGAEHPLPGVAEGGVPQVVAQGGGLGQVLVEAQAPGDGPGDAGDLQGVGHAGAVVVPLGLEKDLGLVHQPPEGLTVDDAVDVPLKTGAQRALLLFPRPAPGLLRQAGVGRELLPLPRLGLLPNGHVGRLLPESPPPSRRFFS